MKPQKIMEYRYGENQLNLAVVSFIFIDIHQAEPVLVCQRYALC